ncbi:hypothetical protein [Winogradskyella sp.]|uniref:hypothetical protein n=1 Tax=Winogradskyella sp. TaxID=1883156 RepID=UPI00261D72DE|nr:hypothetical protein [Winogradskyella sp.]
MKTKLFTIVSGIIICLITSIGVNTELDLYDKSYNTEKSQEMAFCDDCTLDIDECSLECEIEHLEKKIFGNIEDFDVIDPSDIKVIEVEDDIDLLIINQKH